MRCSPPVGAVLWALGTCDALLFLLVGKSPPLDGLEVTKGTTPTDTNDTCN
jgi:hypothetical protein